MEHEYGVVVLVHALHGLGEAPWIDQLLPRGTENQPTANLTTYDLEEQENGRAKHPNKYNAVSLKRYCD